VLLRNGKTSVDDLIASIGASPASIRRNLARLGKQGLVHRTYGGAMMAGQGAPDFALWE
jgi:DeoR family transcriptional regulator, aga operon transcriptional repressor